MKYTDLDLNKCAVTHTFRGPPKIVGYWTMPGTVKPFWTGLGVVKKPNWFHRKMMEVLMGWKWEDAK